MINNKETYFYPLLGANKDCWLFRVAGHGIGNGLYNYFHAFVLAKKHDGKLINPPWPTLKVGPILRGERSKRFYWGIFKPSLQDISGIQKILLLINKWMSRNEIFLGDNQNIKVKKGALNIVSFRDFKFTFDGLYEYRNDIRSRFIEIIRENYQDKISWGKGNYIAVHIRLGDFKVVEDLSLIKKGAVNTRIPFPWYSNIIDALSKSYPDMPVRIFSDGKESDLAPLLNKNNLEIYRGSTDLDDLLTMSGASILVGSRSTFSYWAAFLGNMPSIWLKTEIMDHKISDQQQKEQLFISIDETIETISFD